MSKKIIKYKVENNRKVFVNSKGNKMCVWLNDWYVWIAPLNKLWQSKKFNRSEIELIES